MGISHSEAYAAAGVDIEAGYQGVKMMNRYVQRTLTADVISDLGGFGGLFSLDLHGLEKPVLVSGTDGVGTKQRIAQLMDRHNTVGIDCVAMCVNDIICCGAKPLFFLDYIAIGKNIPEKVVSLVSGVSEGCVRAGCALIGGETAEHPGTMKPDDYDLAGFAVGVVDRDKILDKDKMQPGDVVIALPSSGLHSNGYSLVRKVFDVENADLGQYYGELGCALGEELLRPTKIYVRPVLAAIEAADIRGISHITGGGTNLQALLDAQRDGKMPHGEIVLVVSSRAGAYALTRAENAGVAARVLTPSCGQEPFENELSVLLREQEIDLILLAGFTVILSAEFTKQWPRRILNVHPSLIPAFCGKGMYGLRVHEAALARGVKVTGATVHFVNEIPDGGEILLQKAVEIAPDDTPETLQRRVMEQAEWQMLPLAAERVCAEIVREKEQKND